MTASPAQPSLFDAPRRAAAKDVRLSLEEAFWRFHDRHPEVYEHLKALCLEWRRAGNERWSIDAAFHVLRWQLGTGARKDEGEDFRLNDHFTAFYARLLMEGERELAGFFELRVRHSASRRVAA